MALIIERPIMTDHYGRLPAWLRDLQFVTDFFSWLFALLTRLAEPCMLLCTLYLVAEAGVRSLSQPVLHNLAVAIMICAPEVLLPGAFVVASHAQQHARLLYAVCWTFVLLTLITLISLFIWHLQGDALAWLMCGRCAAAVGYSILMRVMHRSAEQIVATVTRPMMFSPEEIEARIAEAIGQVSTHLQETQRVQIEQGWSRIGEQLTAQITQTVARVNTPTSAQMSDQPCAHAERSSERLSKQPARLRMVASRGRKEPIERIREALMLEPNASDRGLAKLARVSATTVKKYRAQLEQERQAV
jgi:hypothetical protein